MKTQESADTIAFHQARSAAYTLLSAAFLYPDSRLLEVFQEPSTWEAWPSALDACLPGAGAALKKWRSAQPSDLPALEARHVALFGHAVRGSFPLYEMEYGRQEIIQQGAAMADIAGFYAAFGMAIEAQNDRPDFLCVQCEFMAVMAAKEAYALHADEPSLLESVRHAQRKFLAEHLARWLPSLTLRLGDADRDGFYGALAGFAEEFVQGECRRLDLITRPALLAITEFSPEDDAPMECGVETACPGAGEREIVQLGLPSRKGA